MRVCTYTWPFAFGVRLGWASTRVPNPVPGTERGRVYLLRGNGIFFSRGLGDLCGRLRRLGVWAEDLRCVGDRWALRHLAASPPRVPLVFVGHSCGGRYSLFAARRLAERGVRVGLVVCLDVALPPEVPDNVGRAVNLYLARRRLYPARPLRPALGVARRHREHRPQRGGLAPEGGVAESPHHHRPPGGAGAGAGPRPGGGRGRLKRGRGLCRASARCRRRKGAACTAGAVPGESRERSGGAAPAPAFFPTEGQGAVERPPGPVAE